MRKTAPPSHRTPQSRAEVLNDLEFLAAHASDENARRDVLAMRDEIASLGLDEPNGAAEARFTPRRQRRTRFVDAYLPPSFGIPAFVLVSMGALFSLAQAFSDPVEGVQPDMLVAAAGWAAGAALLLWLIRSGRFVVSCDMQTITCRASGRKWQGLRTGSMRLDQVRSIREAAQGRVLIVRGASGDELEIPKCVGEYAILNRFLSNVAGIYGRR